MSASSLILIGILTPTSGILGSLLWPRIQRSLQLHTRTVLVTLVLLASLVPAYGCLGFLPTFKDIGVDVSVSDANDGQTSTYRLRFGGLTSQEEMFALAVYFGTVYGAFQGYARAFYAELIPPGDEARWFGLFSITDKVSPNTSYVHPISQFLTIISAYTVQLFPRTAPSGPHRRPHRKYPLRILLPRRHGLGSRTFVA